MVVKIDRKKLKTARDFRRGVAQAFALQGCYAAYVGSHLPTFRDSL